MANVKITDLTALTSAAGNDELVIEDVSAGVTKKITVDNLLVGQVGTSDLADSAVTVAKIADNAVTADKIYNPYIFRAYRSTNQSCAAGWNTIICQTEEYDLASTYDAGTGTFTAPITGYYQFNASITVGSGWADILIAFWKNGSEYSKGNRFKSSGGTSATNFAASVTLHHSDIIYLTASQYVQLRYYADDGDTVTGSGTSHTYFGGVLITNG